MPTYRLRHRAVNTIGTELLPQRIHAQSSPFSKFRQAPWQTLADTLGVVMGVVVVQRGRHRWSSPEFVEHDLLLGRVQRRAGERFVRAFW